MGSIDPTQLGEWFDAYAAQLVLYARQWLDAAAAEDVVQDVFIRLMGQRTAPENVKGWLIRSVRNAAISHTRWRHRLLRRHRRLAENSQRWFTENCDSCVDGQAVEVGLNSLTCELREIVVLRIWAGLTLREIGDVTGLAVSTVFSRYQRGLAEMRRAVEKCDER